jgi:hypothetical protein
VLGELVREAVEPGSHQVVEGSAAEAERCPVEIVVRDQPVVLLPARTREENVEQRRVRGSG